MDLSLSMNPAQYNKLSLEIDTFNKTLNEGRSHKRELDKDDFLKILITQLSHQDPTKPLEDKEFIAQMAQFSSLEQMTNMNQQISNMADRIAGTQAFSLLGKMVEIVRGDEVISGKVQKIMGGEKPQVMVNGEYFDYTEVETVSIDKEAGL